MPTCELLFLQKGKHKHLFPSFAHMDRVDGYLPAGSKVARTEDSAENHRTS